MRVNPVSNVGFNGLWGKSRVYENNYSQYGGELDIYEKYETKVYHPFKDETNSQIAKVVKDNTQSKCQEGNFERYDTFTKVEVQPKLGFTEKEFQNYQKESLSKRLVRTIEKKLKRANLVEYIKIK